MRLLRRGVFGGGKLDAERIRTGVDVAPGGARSRGVGRQGLSLSLEPTGSGREDGPDVRGAKQSVRPVTEFPQQASVEQLLDLRFGGVQSFGGFLERAEFSRCYCVHVSSRLSEFSSAVSVDSRVLRDSRRFLRRFAGPAAKNTEIGPKVLFPVARRGRSEEADHCFRTLCICCLSSHYG